MRAIAILFAACATPAFAADPLPKMLVLEVRAEEGITKGTANLLGELIVKDVHESHKYDVISMSDMKAVLDVEQKRQVVGCNDDASCLAELGNALGADLILDAGVGTVGTMRVLALKIIDVRRVAVKARETETVAGDDALIDAVHRVTAKLLGLAVPEKTEKADAAGFRPAWFLVGGGGVILGAGALFGVLALSDYHAFQDQPFDDGLGDSAALKAQVADGLFVVGVAAAAAGVIWLIGDDR